MDTAQIFCDAYREQWRSSLATWHARVEHLEERDVTAVWTNGIKDSASEACRIVVEAMGKKAKLGRERHSRLDVFAEDAETGKLLIAFESELAYWGKGSSGKDWSGEFRKLCRTEAELRVLASTFKVGTGAGFSDFLRGCLETMRTDFNAGSPGDFCLIFGPEWSIKDPGQCWLAFSLDRDFTLRPLTSAKPLFPALVMDGKEPQEG